MMWHRDKGRTEPAADLRPEEQHLRRDCDLEVREVRPDGRLHAHSREQCDISALVFRAVYWH